MTTVFRLRLLKKGSISLNRAHLMCPLGTKETCVGRKVFSEISISKLLSQGTQERDELFPKMYPFCEKKCKLFITSKVSSLNRCHY